MMPDIAMCSHMSCEVRSRCYRHKASGTEPNPYLQPYSLFYPSGPNGCSGFWEKKMTNTKKPRGFATMSPEKRKEIASLGGRSVPNEKRSFALNKELAVSAGSKGGRNVPAHKRMFSIDPDFAKAAGKKGGATLKKAEA